MCIIRNTWGLEPSSPGRDRPADPFKQHLEDMRRFRLSHDLAGSDKFPVLPGAPGTEPVEPRKLLETLVIVGHILNMVREYGAVVLPRNGQN